ncbi:MAG: CPBP family intramembrane metalloprotease [Clostridia bacterium]|nr:CPBP family intramembrane metalloprotease [Clostridia bacterium]
MEQIQEPMVEPLQEPQAPSRKQMQSVFGSIGLGLAIALLASQLIQGVVMALPLGIDMQSNAFLFGGLSTALVALPVFFLFVKSLQRQLPQKHSLSVGAFFALVCISYACMVVGNMVGMGVNVLVSPGSVDLVAQLATASGLTPLTVVAFVVLAPVFEELIFRKLLVDRVLPYGEWPAILLSGITFGLYHGNLTQFFYAALLGMVLAYVYIRTGNVLYTMGLHACVNFLGGVLPLLIPEASAVILLVAIAGIVLFFMNKKKIHFEKAKYPGTISAMFLNGGMIVYMLLCLILIASVAILMANPELSNLSALMQ